MKKDISGHYLKVKQRYPDIFDAVEKLGTTLRNGGPLPSPTAQLVQLAAAVAIRSEGAVHSHIKRARQEGVTPEEIYHSILLLTSTVGFPGVMAALSWAYDILED